VSGTLDLHSASASLGNALGRLDHFLGMSESSSWSVWLESQRHHLCLYQTNMLSSTTHQHRVVKNMSTAFYLFFHFFSSSLIAWYDY
jgi:hypothetical protein